MGEWLIVVSDWELRDNWSAVPIVPSLSKLGSGNGLDHVWGVVDGLLLSNDCGYLFLIIRLYNENVVWMLRALLSKRWLHRGYARVDGVVSYYLKVGAGACTTVTNLGNRLAVIRIGDLLPWFGDFGGVADCFLVIVHVFVFAGQRSCVVIQIVQKDDLY